MTTIGRIICLIILTAVSTALISCGKGKTPDKGARVPEQQNASEAQLKGMEESKTITVAKVNGVNISMLDLRKEINTIKNQYLKPGEQPDPKVKEQINKDALDRLIYRELAVQEAQRQGMKATPEMIAKALQQLKTGLKTEEAYKDQLSKSGLSEEALKAQLGRGLLVDMITQKEIDNKVKVTSQQAKKYYEEHKAHFKDEAGKQMTFEQVRPIVEQELMQAAISAREDAWIKELKKTAKIEIMPLQQNQGSQAAK